MLAKAGAIIDELTEDSKLKSDTGTILFHLRRVVQFLGWSGSSGPSHVTCRSVCSGWPVLTLCALASNKPKRSDVVEHQSLTRLASDSNGLSSTPRDEMGCPGLGPDASRFAIGALSAVLSVGTAMSSSALCIICIAQVAI